MGRFPEKQRRRSRPSKNTTHPPKKQHPIYISYVYSAYLHQCWWRYAVYMLKLCPGNFVALPLKHGMVLELCPGNFVVLPYA